MTPFILVLQNYNLADVHASDAQYIQQRVVAQIWDF